MPLLRMEGECTLLSEMEVNGAFLSEMERLDLLCVDNSLQLGVEGQHISLGDGEGKLAYLEGIGCW